MRIVLCDDDVATGESVATLLRPIVEASGFSAEIVRYEDPKKLLFAMDDMVPADIYVLDVMMPGVSGFDVGRKLRAHGIDGIIVYLSRSSDHITDAFDIDAFNYVVKEEDAGRLEQVLRRAVAEAGKRSREYLLLSSIDETVRVPIDEISYFEQDKHACTVHWGRGRTFEFQSTLVRIEARLTSYGFLQTARGILVRGAAIASFTATEATLVDGSVVPISRRRLPDVREFTGRLASMVGGRNVEEEASSSGARASAIDESN